MSDEIIPTGNQAVEPAAETHAELELDRTSRRELSNDVSKQQEPVDDLRSLLRLAVGSVLEGGSRLQDEMRAWERAHPTDKQEVIEPSAPSGELPPGAGRYLAVGLLFRSYDAARQGANLALRSADAVTRLGMAPLKPLARSRLFRPLRRGMDALADRGQTEVNGWVQAGQAEEQRSRELAEHMLSGVIGQVVQEISVNPQVNILIQNQLDLLAQDNLEESQLPDLVRKLADDYITYLEAHPERIQRLVQGQGDGYIDYLHQNPEKVQDLVQGQSLSLTAEIRDEVRRNMITGDTLLEAAARWLFRKPPRSELAPAPPEVRQRALQAHIAGDFPRLEGGPDE